MRWDLTLSYYPFYFCVWCYTGCISCGAYVTLNMIWRDEFELQTWSDMGSVRVVAVVLSVKILKKNSPLGD